MYFSQSLFDKGDHDYDVRLVDPHNYETLYADAIKDRVSRYFLYFACLCAGVLLYWSCTSAFRILE